MRCRRGHYVPNVGDYPTLGFSEVPDINICVVGDPMDPPLGVGEVAAGVATARALGLRIRDLPITGERVKAVALQS